MTTYIWVLVFSEFLKHVQHSNNVPVLSAVFQERPELPPTQAQARARSLPPEQYSYLASILRLVRNRPFMLLVVTYGTGAWPGEVFLR